MSVFNMIEMLKLNKLVPEIGFVIYLWGFNDIDNQIFSFYGIDCCCSNGAFLSWTLFGNGKAFVKDLPKAA